MLKEHFMGVLYMDVERLAAEGKFVEVVKYFNDRSLENATVGEFLALLVSLYHLDAVEDAKKVLEFALTHYPDNIELIVNAAEIYYHTSDLKRAFDFAKEAILRGIQDPYIYDIVGTYYAFIGEELLANVFGEKAYKLLKTVNSEEAQKIREKYNLKEVRKKKILLFGTFGSYIDSFLKFLKNGWEIYVLKNPAEFSKENYQESCQENCWESYEFFTLIGANIVTPDDFENFVNVELKEIDIILYLMLFNEGSPTDKLFSKVKEINYFYTLSAIAKEKGIKGKILVSVDGSFYVYSDFFKNMLSSRLAYVDWIIFETENLKEFFLQSISISYTTNTKVLLFQAPLKEEVRIKFNECYLKYAIFFKKEDFEDIDLPIPLPLISNIFIDSKLVRGKLITEIRQDRDIFANVYGDFAFGIVQDFKNNLRSSLKVSLEKEDCQISLEIGRELSNLINNLKHYEDVLKELDKLLNIRKYMKVPEELLILLQFGIIPILPYGVNDFYDKLCKNNMAICLDKASKLFNLNLVDEKLISKVRENILNNIHLFTFDRFYNFVETIIQ